jgi:hypothetical protein
VTCSYRDGTTHIVLEPLDFMARLAALVPPPRAHRCGGRLKVIASIEQPELTEKDLAHRFTTINTR